jgi:hypothetical protein
MRKNNTIFLYLIIGLLFLIIILRQEEDEKDININIVRDDHDDDYDDYDEPIKEPKRYYDSRYHPRRAMRVNVPTRGEPPAYQQVGILTDTENPENIKPLYGRQTYRGSGQWNYFSSLDSHLATKIPIQLDNNDCTAERGCKEIYKNDTLSIGSPDNQYKANIYQTHAPRYIPYV